MGGNNNKSLKNNSEQAWWQPALVLFAKFSGWIAVPVIAGALIGRWLDGRYGTDPWIFLTAVGFAFLISMFGLIKNIREEYEKIEKDIQERKKDDLK
ncbi:AtpZ/AtpI family protein [Patescibacteria group bacterium]|nr:AtpZ/AtpI family protein [Candidatus Falkowbacteria bacterium]MBU3906538.1 AtpZ/AtpI family protein [Patescibacteria group bacterium]MCG2697747.1 AtpZ/AtpI family protein [Candidatus Parcubacteria bacterium]MBU4015247.1 AtpZ/AtpI family protein [Patescibacteria group bacterium]MBU4026572.1 AtpZ/AtpI family protein [Patescibacteria group bacterium]